MLEEVSCRQEGSRLLHKIKINVNLKNKTKGPSCTTSLTVPVNQILLTLAHRQPLFLVKEDSSEGPAKFKDS